MKKDILFPRMITFKGTGEILEIAENDKEVINYQTRGKPVKAKKEVEAQNYRHVSVGRKQNTIVNISAVYFQRLMIF